SVFVVSPGSSAVTSGVFGGAMLGKVIILSPPEDVLDSFNILCVPFHEKADYGSLSVNLHFSPRLNRRSGIVDNFDIYLRPEKSGLKGSVLCRTQYPLSCKYFDYLFSACQAWHSAS